MPIVRMYGFKLEGGEWLKEDFRKLLSLEWNHFEKNLNQNSVCQKHKANKHSTRKTIGCLYQFTNINLNLKSSRIERLNTQVYTGSLLTKSYIQSSQKPLGIH